MLKKVVRSILLGIAWIFQPVLRLFGWWLPLNYGPFRNGVLLPDSMAIAVVFFVGMLVAPYGGWGGFTIYALAVMASPFFLLNFVQVNNSEARVIRLFGILPYWFHRVPIDAKFDLYEAFEDPAPTGVAFEASSSSAYELHLGTARNAAALFAYVGSLLSSAGWKRTSLGYEHPNFGGKAP